MKSIRKHMSDECQVFWSDSSILRDAKDETNLTQPNRTCFERVRMCPYFVTVSTLSTSVRCQHGGCCANYVVIDARLFVIPSQIIMTENVRTVSYGTLACLAVRHTGTAFKCYRTSFNCVRKKNLAWVLFTYEWWLFSVDVTSVKKSGEIRQHSKQLRVG